MRLRDKATIQGHRATYALLPTLRVVRRISGWLGEAFFGLTLATVSVISRLEKSRDTAQRRPRPLLPVHSGRDFVPKAAPMKGTFKCDSCRRFVDLIVELLVIENGVSLKLLRCLDCADIAEQKMNRYLNYEMN